MKPRLHSHCFFIVFFLLSYFLQIPSYLQWNSLCFCSILNNRKIISVLYNQFIKTIQIDETPGYILCFWQRFLSISRIPLIIEYAGFFINHLVCSIYLLKCPPVRDAALAISRKDDHSACIFRDFAVGQHFCATHLPAYCHQNAVQNRCARNLLEPHFNNKSECLTRRQVMYWFQ